MFKIKNHFILGVLSGLPSAFIGGILNSIEYKLGLIDVKYNQIATALFLPKSKKNEFCGSIIRYIIICMISTFIGYVLTLSGRRNATGKTIGIVLASWALSVELIPKFLLNMRIRKPLYHYLTFLDHVLSAIVISRIILKFARFRYI